MESAGRLIPKLKLPKDAANPEARACGAWAKAAGKKIAEHTRARCLVRGTLVVEVEDLVWQRQLNTLRHFILRNFTRLLGETIVSDIDFRPMPRRMQPQRALHAGGQEPVPTGAEGIQDPVFALLYRQSKHRNSA